MAERVASTRVGRLLARLRDRAADETGTILLLVPAGLLVVIMLGSMAFDLSLAYAGERRLADLAATWANDALARLDLEAFYSRDQVVRIDREGARRAVLDAWAALDDPGLVLETPPTVTFPDELTVEVTVVGEVPLLFLDVVGVGPRRVDTTSTVSLVVTE